MESHFLQEVCRYLRLPPTPQLTEEIAALKSEVERTAPPRFACCEYPLTKQADGFLLGTPKGICLEGHTVARHLQGATHAVLMAITLGEASERMLEKKRVQNLSQYLMLDAVLSTFVEDCLEQAYQAKQTFYQNASRHLYPRFSAGYGDFGLGVQTELVGALNLQKRFGVRVLPSGMMYPNKTITALAGVGDTPKPECQSGCAACQFVCEYRREK